MNKLVKGLYYKYHDCGLHEYMLYKIIEIENCKYYRGEITESNYREKGYFLFHVNSAVGTNSQYYPITKLEKVLFT